MKVEEGSALGAHGQGLAAPVMLVGKVALPEFFWLGAYPEGDPWRIALQYQIVDGEITVPAALSQRLDLPEALDKMKRAASIQQWTRYAIVRIVNIITQREIAADIDVAGEGDDLDAWGAAFQARLVPAVQAANALPLDRRRNRVTDAHLRHVAQVYIAAEAQGRPPTQAVADAFHAGHSTAARWVGMARDRLGTAMPPPTRGVKKGSGRRPGTSS